MCLPARFDFSQQEWRVWGVQTGRCWPSKLGILSIKIWALLGGFGGISTFKHNKIESNENRQISTGWEKTEYDW
jgi:hypothetical protein